MVACALTCFGCAGVSCFRGGFRWFLGLYICGCCVLLRLFSCCSLCGFDLCACCFDSVWRLGFGVSLRAVCLFTFCMRATRLL